MTHAIEVRPADDSDRDFVVGLASTLLKYGSPAWTDPARFAAGFRMVLADAVDRRDDRTHPVFVAQGADGVRLGFISLKTVEHIGGVPRGHVADLAVIEQARRLGVGRALVNTAEAWAREHGIPVLSLDVWSTNHPAQAFYSEMGYRPESLSLFKRLD